MTPWADLAAAVAKRISGERLAHVYRVLETARGLAAQYGVDRAQADVAALLHDYAKAMPEAELLVEARRRGLIIDPAEEKHPDLLHGAVAAAQLAEQRLVTDPAVLDAIHWHTTGRAGMSRLEMVIWLADYIEPGRAFPGLDEIRETADWDLERALLMALDHTIAYVLSRGSLLHVYTVHARNWLLTR
ncbi:MAG TPA: bis(5'-nucleosyl)-tetraphosphatase (symmetrical) YqeK [Symbiobacteriaceae bacterium]|nr:bis(5'-nucleosyl)-tetraphosphatase (symmetrical) YqeK [Symbiobacteriaceae bacterium]